MAVTGMGHVSRLLQYGALRGRPREETLACGSSFKELSVHYVLSSTVHTCSPVHARTYGTYSTNCCTSIH